MEGTTDGFKIIHHNMICSLKQQTRLGKSRSGRTYSCTLAQLQYNGYIMCKILLLLISLYFTMVVILLCLKSMRVSALRVKRPLGHLYLCTQLHCKTKSVINQDCVL